MQTHTHEHSKNLREGTKGCPRSWRRIGNETDHRPRSLARTARGDVPGKTKASTQESVRTGIVRTPDRNSRMLVRGLSHASAQTHHSAHRSHAPLQPEEGPMAHLKYHLRKAQPRKGDCAKTPVCRCLWFVVAIVNMETQGPSRRAQQVPPQPGLPSVRPWAPAPPPCPKPCRPVRPPQAPAWPPHPRPLPSCLGGPPRPCSSPSGAHPTPPSTPRAGPGPPLRHTGGPTPPPALDAWGPQQALFGQGHPCPTFLATNRPAHEAQPGVDLWPPRRSGARSRSFERQPAGSFSSSQSQTPLSMFVIKRQNLVTIKINTGGLKLTEQGLTRWPTCT